MKALLFSLLFFITAPEERIKEQNVLQTLLEAPELIEHFSYLPRYQRTGETYYFLLKNDQVESGWQLNINNNAVAILQSEELKKMGKYFYMEVQNLELKGSEASIRLLHKYDRLYREEQKQLIVTAQLFYKEGEWRIKEIVIDKINI
jgi:hypothetical protein